MIMAGRPRKPTNILALKGAFKKDPARLKKREGEPVDDNPVGEPPMHLSENAKQAWNEIISTSIGGVLGQADRIAIEMAANALVKCRGLPGPGGEIAKITMSDQTLLFKYLSQFGMTPADRSKIRIPAKKKKNDFDD